MRNVGSGSPTTACTSSLHPLQKASAGPVLCNGLGSGPDRADTRARDVITCRWDPVAAQSERPKRPRATMAAASLAPAWRTQYCAVEGPLAPPLPFSWKHNATRTGAASPSTVLRSPARNQAPRLRCDLASPPLRMCARRTLRACGANQNRSSGLPPPQTLALDPSPWQPPPPITVPCLVT
ncbi:hypothetical protein H920_03021 [Fukomys damarensis]|uniref:Uncharacterized protein n=1 Tax=Fukomys damarensis TaxID=885580 RepID=A0A091DZ33_FUKDA|nr:hypothetical protein H920_03021 [Fukomys damarensis]